MPKIMKPMLTDPLGGPVENRLSACTPNMEKRLWD